MLLQLSAGAMPGSRWRNRTMWAGVIVLAILALLAPAFWNGFPLLQYDTGGYLARWYEGYLVPSRPGAYGLLLAAAVPLHFWPVLVLQAAVTLWVLALVLRTHGLGGRPFMLLALVAPLSIATTLPWIASILLTDIFAGLAVLALHLLVFCNGKLGRFERWGLVVVTAFAAATHSATLGLLVVLAGAAACLCTFRRDLVSVAAVARVAGTVAFGVVLTLAGNYAVSGHMAWTPGGYGILFGRMLQDGIVARYLDAHCKERPLKLCPFRAELPRDADAFLWGQSAFNQLGRFTGLGDEMRSIVLGSLHDYPAMQIKSAVAASASQLVRAATGEGVRNTVWHTYRIMERYTPTVLPAMKAARQQHGDIGFDEINRLHVPVALSSMVLLLAWIALGLRRKRFAPFGRLAATIAVALLANAVVCGALANPHNRYGARFVWLAPLVALMIPLALGLPARSPQQRLLGAQPALRGRERVARA
jgi:hypothetical protein